MRSDQFYTKPKIAGHCFITAIGYIDMLNIEKPFYVEPAAGTGSFYDLMPPERRLGLDIEPKHPDVRKQNYLTCNLNEIPKPAVVIGNPPYGYTNSLTIQFVNISALFADLIGFIVPVTFHRYFFANRLNRELHLISRTSLPDDSFYKPDGSDYKIPCEFLVWSKKLGPFTDLREREIGPSKHPDFEMVFLCGSPKKYLFEDRKAAVYKNKPFCFGTMAQGYIGSPNAGMIKESLEEITSDKNWILFYTDDPEIKERLLNLDFKAIYQKYGFIHSGFRRTDIVEAYNEKYEPKNKIAEQLSILEV